MAPPRPGRRAVASGLLALLAAGCGETADLDGLAPGPRGRVGEIPAGDALGLTDGRRVRLAGVEAPKVDQPYATIARDEAAALAEAAEVELLFGGAREDPFGRTVAHVRLSRGRRWLQAALLDRGAARVRTYADNRALAAAMLAHEARARAAGRGLWALAAYRVLLPQELSPEARGLQIVEGEVRRIGRAGERLYLDFAEDWRSAASVDIARTALPAFASAGLDPETLQGRLIRVRGPARDRTITVDHPEQIELLRR